MSSRDPWALASARVPEALVRGRACDAFVEPRAVWVPVNTGRDQDLGVRSWGDLPVVASWISLGPSSMSHAPETDRASMLFSILPPDGE